jgi:hypothetical protein
MYNSIATPTACAVLHLLLLIPESWKKFNRDTLTAAEDEAVGHLMASGLIELRWCTRITLPGHPTEFHATLRRTGCPTEDDSFTARLYAEWGPTIEDWRAAHPNQKTPVHFEVDQEQEWRLTDQGVLAREDVRSENREKWEYVADWALHRRDIANKPYPEGRFQVVSLKLVSGRSENPVPPVTNIGNWSEGVAQFKTEFAEILAKATSTPRARIGPMTAKAFGEVFDDGKSTERTYLTRLKEWDAKKWAFLDGKGDWYIYVDALSEGMKRRAGLRGYF